MVVFMIDSRCPGRPTFGPPGGAVTRPTGGRFRRCERGGGRVARGCGGLAQTAVPPHWVAGRARNGVADSRRLLDGPPSLCYWRRGTGVGEGVRRGPRTKGSVRPETCHRQGFHRATQSLAVWGHSRDRSQVVPARAPSGRLRNFGHGSPPRKKNLAGQPLSLGEPEEAPRAETNQVTREAGPKTDPRGVDGLRLVG